MGYNVGGVGGVGGVGYGPGVGGVWTSTGAILVLFILLVIILKGCGFY
ncbi:hypothetical protein ACFOQM_23935 [Paenibacillus sp. GCM10012307]|uniref:Sporulation protein YjcZ n=1 Tax=Paenibacillus roseus TaxID=2798579 RepID=A0A934J7D0_9BACL|nr:hypothetical protein [Paenibacillus roseus]MBJ6364275.1 hypothetical protein [Paenibacillus roseus]